MALIDSDVILNGNPTKRLRIAFENMKSDYTDSSAKAYMETYKDQPLAFIIENSRYIFAEPMYGLKFYTESVISNDHAFLFTEYENEKEKIEAYLDENGQNMPDTQKQLYEDLLSLVTERYNETVNTAIIISHACNDDIMKSEYDTLVESVYTLENKPENILDIEAFIESTNSPDLFYAISPYLVKLTNGELNYHVISNINRFFNECTVIERSIDPDEWKHYIESAVIVSKLYHDDIYQEAVSSMRRQGSMIFEGLAFESVKSQIDELFVEHVTENAGANKFNANVFDCYYSTPVNAVNRIFDDDYMYSIMKEDNEKFKMERTKLHEIAMNVLFEYVTHEYQICHDTDSSITGYNYFSEDTSIDNAFFELAGSPFIVKEADANDDADANEKDDNDEEDANDEEDVSDDDINNAESEVSEDDPADSQQNTNQPTSTPSKAIPPKDKNLSNKVQHKAMDKEAKFLQKRAQKQQRGVESKNAAKAVTAIPANIVNSIKDFFASWDKMDDNRRKEYIVKPGYRKKIFRNLKVALMYGAGASAHLATVPVIYMARKLSKHKDRRIRNELARELDTEIKVCEEKINDANTNNDQQKKYELMRIKSELEKEALRVKSNSRYI